MAGEVEVVGVFSGEDYARGYVCVGPARCCSPRITIAADGVWFRERPDGLQQSSHRGCLGHAP